MLEASSESIDAVAKLTELTQTGQLLWKDDWSAVMQTPSPVLSPVYTASYKSVHLRLHKRHIVGAALWQKQEEFVLELVGDFEESLWTFPRIDAIEDLYAAVQYRTGEIKGILDDILAP